MGAGSSADKDREAFDAVVSTYKELQASEPHLTPEQLGERLRAEYASKLGGGPFAAARAAGSPGDYDAVRASLLSMMDDESWDDGSYGPILIRLAWHSSGAFSSAVLARADRHAPHPDGYSPLK